MDEQVLERARRRVAEARTDGIGQAKLDAALERARAEVMRLAQVADELESSLPKQVGIAVRDGIAREVVPVSRSLAEIRGGVNQALRRLERLEDGIESVVVPLPTGRDAEQTVSQPAEQAAVA
jgi:hypothetical protein